MESQQSPDQRRRPPLLGERFVVVRWIGKGAAAHVYMGYDLENEAWCALKVMHPKVAMDATMRRRFVREANTMAAIDDPHVVRVLERTDGILPYIAMEYVGGGGVLEWLRVNGAMAPRMAVGVARDVALALVATHDCRVVHRDVKPHNVLIGLDGVCRLTDYGIAKTLDDSMAEKTLNHEASIPEGLTRVGTAMGTASFMPPEQQHDASSVDERADLYALGSTLFTLLKRKAAQDLYVADASDPQFEGIDPAIVQVIIKACRYNPSDRYQSAGAMASALDAVIAALPPDPEGHPSLVPAASELPAGPPERIDREHAPELMDLVATGAVRAWSPDGVGDTLAVDDYTLTPMAADRVAPPVAKLGPSAADADEEDTEASMVEEEETETGMAPVLPTLPAAEQVEQVAAANGRAMAAVGALVLMLLLFSGASYVVASQAAAAHQRAGVELEGATSLLVDVSQRQQRAIQLLSTKGADEARLRAAVRRVADAREPEARRVAALALTELLVAQRDAVATRYGQQPNIDQELQPLIDAAASVERSQRDLDRAAAGAGGYLAGALGLI